MKAAGYQSASVTLGASGFQERKEAWGHPAPLPPCSSKQPGPADNGAVSPAAQESRAAGRTRCPKREVSPCFLTHQRRPRCWGSGSRCWCCVAIVHGEEQHHALAMPQFHPSASCWWELGGTGLGLLHWGREGARDMLPARLSRHKAGNPGARLNWDVSGQKGVRWQVHAWVLSHHLLPDAVSASSKPAEHWASHQNNGGDPLHHPATQSAPGGSRDWSLLHPDTENNYMIMRFGSKVQINL